MVGVDFRLPFLTNPLPGEVVFSACHTIPVLGSLGVQKLIIHFEFNASVSQTIFDVGLVDLDWVIRS